MQGRLATHTLDSKALRDNPLGDPAERPLFAYLPPSHGSGAMLPVVYFLHGFTGSAYSWAEFGGFSPNVPERLDGLIAAGVIPEVIGAFVDGWTELGGSQWINSDAIGRYRDYLVEDVVPFVDRELGALPRAAARAVVGRSSGGYGALVMGRHHPDVFGHIAAHAPDAAFEYCYLPDFPATAGALLGTDAESWFDGMRERARETRLHNDDFAVLHILAMAAAYSPRAGEPLGLELPFDPDTCRLRPEVWERWLEHDPARFVPASLASFARLSTIFFDCGEYDEFRLRWGVRMVVESLRDAGIDVFHEEFDGGHRGTDYRYERALQILVPRMERG